MRKKIFLFCLIGIFSLIFSFLVTNVNFVQAGTVGGDDTISAGGPVELEPPTKWETFGELIEAIINFIFWVAVALAPLLIVIAAFYFLTSAGDPTKIQTGKNIILYTCIGLFIILFAKGLIAVIQSILGVE